MVKINKKIVKYISLFLAVILVSGIVISCGMKRDKTDSKTQEVVSSETVSVQESSEKSEVIEQEVVGNFAAISFEEYEKTDYVAAEVVAEVTTDVGVVDGDQALKVTYKQAQWPGIQFDNTAGSTWSLQGNTLQFYVENISDKDVALCIKLDSTTSNGTLGDNTYVANIKANSGDVVSLATTVGNEVSNLGMRALPPTGDGIIANAGWGNGALDLGCINRITFWINNNPEEVTLIFDDIKFVDDSTRDLEDAYTGLVDEFGQYTKNENSNKIVSEEDFIHKLESEEAILTEQLQATQERDLTKYFGYKDESKRQEATGKYYVTKIGEEWTFIDPEGYPYISTGADIIRVEDASTWVSGREYMFDNIPAKDSELGDHYTELYGSMNPPMGLAKGDGYNFYTANLERKYGEDWYASWVDTAIERFKAWGFSSLGCWSDPATFNGQGSVYEFPYTAHVWINQNHQKVNNNTVSDPFDPAFREEANRQMQTLKDQGVANDPYCVGVFVDNEIYWGEAEIDNQKYHVIEGVFAQCDANNENAYVKRAFMDYLKDEYRDDIKKLNFIWKTEFASWEELEAPYQGPIPKADASECLALIADEYYRVVSEVVNEYLGDTLYLGSRLNSFGAGFEVVQACAKYADVVSFNVYRADVNQSFLQLDTFDKPVIIGEFHFTGNDNNNFSVATAGNGTDEQARADAYVNYMTSVFENPKFVGAHWFQYYDQPTLGRAWDGENYSCGFVDVTDQPYQLLVSMAKEVNEQAYDLKFEKPKPPADMSEVTFPTISFEEGEEIVYTTTEGKDIDITLTDAQGVTDGTNAAIVQANEVTKDENEQVFSAFQIINEDGFNLGSGTELAFDVMNTNEFFTQIRVDISDINGSMRTYYFSVQPLTAKACSISEFGQAADLFLEDGYYGAADTGLDTTAIQKVSIYMWETEPGWLDDANLTSASFAIDHIRIQ